MFSRKPKHKALIITDDRRLRPVTLEIDSGFVVDHRSNRAWALTAGAVITERRRRLPYLILYERHDSPYIPGKHKWAKHDEHAINVLARECVDKQFASLPKEALAEKAANTFRICIAGLTLTVAVMAMVVLMSSGQLKFPGL